MLSESAPTDTAGGKNHRLRPGRGEVSDRKRSANFRASPGPWFIFQFAAYMSWRSLIAPAHPERRRGISRLYALHVIQCGHARQLFPLEKLQRCAAPGRYMRDALGQSRLRHRSRGVAPADNSHRSVLRCCGHGVSYCQGTMIEWRCLEHAHRAIPHDCAGRFDEPTEGSLGLFIDVIYRPAWWNRVPLYRSRLRLWCQLLGNDGAHRQDELVAGFLDQVTSKVQTLWFHQGLSGLESHGREK